MNHKVHSYNFIVSFKFSIQVNINMVSKYCCSLYFQTYMEDGKCMSGYFIKGPIGEKIYVIYAYAAFISCFAMPTTCFFFLYGMVALRLQRRKRDSNFESNR